MDDYIAQAPNIFSEGASRTAISESSLNTPMLTELQRSRIMMGSFVDALKTFSNGLQHHRSAKAHHSNALLPISHLPNDLLVDIFALACETKKYFSMQSDGSRTGVYMLATFVSVCHEWREIVHNAPSLWAYISSNHSDRTNLECLTRSDQVPLHVFFNYPYVISREFKRRIFQVVHRWKSAKLFYVPIKSLEELEQRPAPLLESFYLHGGGSHAKTPNLFCGSANQLRHLTLVHSKIQWVSDLLSRLTTLDIEYFCAHGPSARQVVQILQSCPDLTSFKLTLPPKFDPGPLPLEASIVKLPQLEFLYLKVHPLLTEHLLRRIRIPSCKSFNVDYTEATGPTFSTAMKHLEPSLSSILLAASRLRIDIKSTGLEYETIPKINEGEEEEKVGRLVQHIHITTSGDRSTNGFALETLSWLLDTIHTPSFSSPVSLDIRGLASSPPLTLIIDKLSPIVTYLNLELSGISAKTILSYLAKPFKVVIDGAKTLRWPLPNLTELSVEGCGDLESEVVLHCVQRRAGRGLSSDGSRKQREELPAGLTLLHLPGRLSIA
ncbi:hypothetical protein FRB93_007104 [Tulasnella sp. JGI-2019a]|nr:hypothetical protein FRB93_007104 [Tulasnella sp. JGI-2019a]